MNKISITLCLAGLLYGCAAKELYVVMPEENGKAGSVTVTRDGKQIELHGAYSAAQVSAFGGSDTVNVDPGRVKETFGAALAAQPMRPVSFTLYFVEGTDKWTAESQKQVNGILKEIARRPAPEVTVIGHTDTVGSSRDNDALSLKRSQKVRNALIKLGISSERIATAGRGERELLVATPDNTDEPRNRRDEIGVR